ncbi:MAG: hypothetical protein JSR09_04525 [Bacteroidetes bacterium]|nr:hypothetical protein [Bacteroidota bacterium]MBS1648951.1 hypothetical protein [Bacteroidota bacterium]
MLATKSTIFKKIILFSGCVYSLIYFLSCLTPYIKPSYSWVFSILALGFPFLFAGMLLLLLLNFLVLKKYRLVFVVITLLGYQNISTIFSFHPFHKFSNEKKGDFRLLSWNASDFVNTQKSTDTAGNPRHAMLSFIKQTNADIICLEDFSNKNGKGFFNVFNYIKDSLGYVYTYFPLSFTYYLTEMEETYGNVIFSKYPIIDTGKIALPFSEPSEFLSYVDVKIKEKKIRFYTAHLLSLSLHTSSTQPVQINLMSRDSSLILHKSTLKKLWHFDKLHTQQAITIKQTLNATTIPFVFSADINSVPSTYTYQHLKNGLQDAFLQNGFGIGRTYDSISPTLRIDVVLFNNLLKAVQHKTPVLHLSDHYPNIVDFQFK